MTAADHVQAALHQLLAAAVLLNVPSNAIPDDALDHVLRNDPDVQHARQGVHAALQGVQAAGTDTAAVLDVEAATNALAARCAEAGYRLGVLVSGGAVRTQRDPE